MTKEFTPELPVFQSTRPAGGATVCKRVDWIRISCFNPRAPRGARQLLIVVDGEDISVSIHAPRGGRDLEIIKMVVSILVVSIHAPRGGRDCATSE